MSFNFGSLSNVQPSSAINYLKPYGIYPNVVIDKTEVLEGTSADGNPWKRLEITFKNDEGIYKHSIFWINQDKDFERTVIDTANGGKREFPSSWERTRDTMAAIGFAYAPEAFTKLQAASAKAKSFDDIALSFKKILDSVVGKNPTYMKLVGRTSNGTVYATLPYCTGCAQANTQEKADRAGVALNTWYTWMVSPFNSNPAKLAFSAYEQQQADEYNKAKPSKVDNSTKATDDVNNFDSPGTTEEANFDDLIAGL